MPIPSISQGIVSGCPSARQWKLAWASGGRACGSSALPMAHARSHKSGTDSTQGSNAWAGERLEQLLALKMRRFGPKPPAPNHWSSEGEHELPGCLKTEK